VSGLETFLWACFGGGLGELFGHYQLRREPHKGSDHKSLFYWVVTALMILAGGGIALAYVSSGQDLIPMLAINVGATAPLIIAGLTRRVPPIPPGDVD
jgi:hypothetical protein